MSEINLPKFTGNRLLDIFIFLLIVGCVAGVIVWLSREPFSDENKNRFIHPPMDTNDGSSYFPPTQHYPQTYFPTTHTPSTIKEYNEYITDGNRGNVSEVRQEIIPKKFGTAGKMITKPIAVINNTDMLAEMDEDDEDDEDDEEVDDEQQDDNDGLKKMSKDYESLIYDNTRNTVMAGSEFIRKTGIITPLWIPPAWDPDAVGPSSKGELDPDDYENDPRMLYNKCSLSCCGPQYPTPFNYDTDPFVCDKNGNNKYLSSDYLCTNNAGGTGCLCLTPKQVGGLGKGFVDYYVDKENLRY
jgi:hypothetical protein